MLNKQEELEDGDCTLVDNEIATGSPSLALKMPKNKTKFLPKTCKNSQNKVINKGKSSVKKSTDREFQVTINRLKKEQITLKTAIKILVDYSDESKLDELINKWQSISQKAMSYILNMTLLKINKMGGYEEFIKKEIEGEKRKLEYVLDDNIEQEMENVFESPEFQELNAAEQEEYREMMNDKIREMESNKEKELRKLDAKLQSASNKDLDMEELAKRLKVDHKLIFPQ